MNLAGAGVHCLGTVRGLCSEAIILPTTMSVVVADLRASLNLPPEVVNPSEDD
jgi:hypothetical protein